MHPRAVLVFWKPSGKHSTPTAAGKRPQITLSCPSAIICEGHRRRCTDRLPPVVADGPIRVTSCRNKLLPARPFRSIRARPCHYLSSSRRFVLHLLYVSLKSASQNNPENNLYESSPTWKCLSRHQRQPRSSICAMSKPYMAHSAPHPTPSYPARYISTSFARRGHTACHRTCRLVYDRHDHPRHIPPPTLLACLLAFASVSPSTRMLRVLRRRPPPPRQSSQRYRIFALCEHDCPPVLRLSPQSPWP